MTRPLVIVLLLLAWGASGYWAGDKNRNNAWLAKQAVAERNARLALEAEVQRGHAAAQRAIADSEALQNSYSTLEGKFNELRARGPMLVTRSRHQADPAASQGGATGATQAPAQPGGTPAPASVASADVDAAGLSLSLGAVWMWNSALAGFDAPAGACGALDTAAPACALDAGLSLDAAWANHIANAKTCAQDRLRHQRLIDFVTTGPRP